MSITPSGGVAPRSSVHQLNPLATGTRVSETEAYALSGF